MFKKMAIGLLLISTVGLQRVSADQILFDWAFNLNGVEYLASGGLPAVTGLTTVTDPATGLGTYTLSYDPGTIGYHFVGAFFDLEFSETVNTYFNETAVVNGIAPNGLIWEVDEPGYVSGNIYTNLLAGSFDNTNALDGITDDVSVGFGWNFTLEANQSAEFVFSILDVAPAAGGFYIKHLDSDSDESAAFTTSMRIFGEPPTNVPEPASSSMLLIGSLLISVLVTKRRK